MPDYKFVCKKCRRRFSKTLTMTEYEKKKKRIKCPHCGSTSVERRFDPFYVMTPKKS